MYGYRLFSNYSYLYATRCLPTSSNGEFINKIVRYKAFSTFNLKLVYHQIPIHEDDNLIKHLKVINVCIILFVCHVA